jgi:hypothetical protein
VGFSPDRVALSLEEVRRSGLADGLQLRRTNDAAINDARRVCTRYASGESEQQIIQDMLARSPGMSLNPASGFADTAISVYCPDGYIDHP